MTREARRKTQGATLDFTKRDAELASVLKSLRPETPPMPGPSMHLRRDGLIVPDRFAKEAEPDDLIHLYATSFDILERNLGAEFVLQILDRTTLSDVARFATHWLGKILKIDADWPSVDQEFCDIYLKGDAKRRAEVLIGKDYIIVLPQALILLLKLGLFRCGREPRDSRAVGLLPAAMSAVAFGLGSGADGTAEDDGTTRLIGELIANQHFNNGVDIATQLALYEARWFSVEFADGAPLADTYRTVIGVPLEVIAAVVLSTWAHMNSTAEAFITRDLFRDLNLPPALIDQALEIISADPGQLRDAFAELEESAEGWDPTAWNFSPFERWPLMRLDGGWYVVSPKFLLNRALAWLPVLDIEYSLNRRGKTAESGTWKDRIGKTTERYVQTIVANSYAQLPGRVLREEDLRSTLQVPGKVADVAIDYGHAWVLLEISTRRLQRPAVMGDGGRTLDYEVDGLCAKARQLDDTIKRLRQFRSEPTRRSSSSSTRFYPVILLTEGYPINPLVLNRLREVLKMKNVLVGRDTSPIELMSLDELEAVESLAGRGGPTLLEILSSKADGGMRLGAVRDHMLLSLHLESERPRRVLNAVERVLDSVAELFPHDA